MHALQLVAILPSCMQSFTAYVHHIIIRAVGAVAVVPAAAGVLPALPV
jgi:hypothetical protein